MSKLKAVPSSVITGFLDIGARASSFNHLVRNPRTPLRPGNPGDAFLDWALPTALPSARLWLTNIRARTARETGKRCNIAPYRVYDLLHTRHAGNASRAKIRQQCSHKHQH